MGVVVALDQGTTSSRALVFGADGRVLGMAQREFPQVYPRPGWVEHDPEEIWSSQISTMTEAMSRAGVRAREVSAIGITNQRETVVVWDRATGRPVGNAIVWQDRRTAAHCARIRAEGKAEEIRKRTGLVVDPYFSATKVAWMLEHVPGLRARAERGEVAFGTVDSWVLWRLTGGRVHATDASNASRTMLWNIHTQEWDEELLEMFGVPRAMVPEVRDSSGVFGATSADLIAAEIPIAGMVGDQQSALFGQGCFEPGMGKCTYGTGAFVLVNAGGRAPEDPGSVVGTVGWRRGGVTTYALEGSMFIAGAAVTWLRDGLGVIESASEAEGLARSVEDTGDVFLVPAFAGLGAPHWDAEARGVIVGLTRGTTRAHLARAALESIALQVADVLACTRRECGVAIDTLRVDGGAAMNDLLMQMQADYAQCPVERPSNTETTALGAAHLAGLAVGVWKDVGELAGHRPIARRFEPRMDARAAEAHRARWMEAVERAKGWARS